jgi:CRP-like cAMP-binding protein
MSDSPFDQIITYINSQLAEELSEEEKEIVKKTFKPKRLRKHQFILIEGEVCKIAGFVVEGALKQYTVDESGKEHILNLYIENWWAGDRESYANGTPSPYYIEAFEETQLLVVSKLDYVNILSKQRFMNDLLRTLIERNSLQLLKRVHSSKTLSAEQRLADFESVYPEFLQRFPQHIIASYLGMTKETFSRIRAKSARG